MTDTPIVENKLPIFVKYVTVLVVIMLATGAGWLLVAYAPVWVAPPIENFHFTFLSYMLVSGIMWIGIPLVLWRRWHLKISNKIRLFVVIPLSTALVFIWIIGFSLFFGSRLSHSTYQNMVLNLLATRYPVCDIQSNANHTLTYNCSGCPFDDEEYGNLFSGSCWNYTFEGREGLPFVWYTGEIIPEQNGDD